MQIRKKLANIYIKNPKISCGIAIFLIVLLANSISLFVTDTDPVYQRSGLNINSSEQMIHVPILSGDTIDPNDGNTKQSLGIEANRQLSQGQLPLWNYNEGVGTPLLGETQSAALFPFTPLLSLSFGWQIYHIVLESLAGIGTFFFLRKLLNNKKQSQKDLIAMLGGILFALNPTFFMLTNACFNPIAFLPWQLLAVSFIFDNIKNKFLTKQTIYPIILFITSLVLALLSGFPETAYIQGILVVIFAIYKLVKTEKKYKLQAFRNLAIGGAVAIFISLPWLIEFLTFIKPENGFNGGHGDGAFATAAFANNALTYLTHFFPNLIGYDDINTITGSIGGVFNIVILFFAIISCISRKNPLWVKILFGGWFIIGWLRLIGAPGLIDLMQHIPFLGQAAVHRYLTSSMELALIILACFGLNSIAKNEVRRRNLAIVTIIVTLFGLAIVFGAVLDKVFNPIIHSSKMLVWTMLYGELNIGIFLVIIYQVLSRYKLKMKLIVALLISQALLFFVPWQLGAPQRPVEINTSAVEFLQNNLGNQRFDSDKIQSNYGSYFGISQLNHDDLPVPVKWVNYRIQHDLPVLAGGVNGYSNFGSEEYINEIAKLGVKYIVVPTNELDQKLVDKMKLQLVYGDNGTQILEIPNYKEYFTASNCELTTINKAEVDVNCETDSELLRLELNYPGWTATIDDENIEINNQDDLFQKINISQGKHKIKFIYWPKNMTISATISIISVIAIISSAVYVERKNIQKAFNKIRSKK